MSIAQYARDFPILKTMQNPRGQVQLIETIGKGNYGSVYKAKLLKENEIVAIKVVFLKEDEIKETLLEMEILEKCVHPNITRFHQCFLKGLDLWIAMEFCGAGAVDSVYKALKKPLPEDAISAIIYETVLALEYLHTKVGLIHRDIKSGNLLLTESGQVKLADFGVSAMLKSVGGRANTFIGTPYWMAPEVIMCDPDNPKSGSASYTDRSDIWSIGITVIEVAEKNPPLCDIHPMQALNLIPKTNIGLAKPKNFSRQLVDFVAFCLEKNPEKRPSATECLKHPFLAPSATADRGQILTLLVDKVKNIREKKKLGIEIVDEDEDFTRDQSQIPPKAIQETIKNAQKAQESLAQQEQGFQGHANQEFPTPPSFSDFPNLENKIQDGVAPVFDPIALTSLTTEVNTASFLDGQYILLGTEKGMAYLNIMKPAMKIPVILIHNVRFKQIEILPEYNALIGLSGKHDQIRQYSLSSIRRLILFNEGNAASLIAKTDTTVPLPDVVLGGNETPSNEYSYLHTEDNVDEATLISRWTNDFIKIIGTKDTKEFYIEQTESTAFLITFGAGIVLFRWAAEPYKKFMKIKEFWVPEQPKFVSFAQDGLEITDIFLGYSSELNRVSVATSKVTTINTHKEMKTKGFGSTRWQSILQIPYSDAKLSEVLRENARASGTSIRKLAAVNGPTLKRQPTMQQRYFLGTYHRMTKVVDENGHPMVGASVGGWQKGVVWSDPPVEQILRPLQTVASVGKNNIEIVDWKSAELRQRLTVGSSGTFKVFSNKHGQTLIGVEKKKQGILLYWMRESSEPPRVVGALLAKIIMEQQPQGYDLKAQSPITNEPKIDNQLKRLAINPGETFDQQFGIDKDLPERPHEGFDNQPRFIQSNVEPDNDTGRNQEERLKSPSSESFQKVPQMKQPSAVSLGNSSLSTPLPPRDSPAVSPNNQIYNLPKPGEFNRPDSPAAKAELERKTSNSSINNVPSNQYRPPSAGPPRVTSPDGYDPRYRPRPPVEDRMFVRQDRPSEGYYRPPPEGYIRPPQEGYIRPPPEGFIRSPQEGFIRSPQEGFARPPHDGFRPPIDDPRYHGYRPNSPSMPRPYPPGPNARPLPRPDPRYMQGPPPPSFDPRYRPHAIDNRSMSVSSDGYDHPDPRFHNRPPMDPRYQQRPPPMDPRDPRFQQRPPMDPRDPRYQDPRFQPRPPMDPRDPRFQQRPPMDPRYQQRPPYERPPFDGRPNFDNSRGPSFDGNRGGFSPPPPRPGYDPRRPPFERDPRDMRPPQDPRYAYRPPMDPRDRFDPAPPGN
ncbi:hypothetical protein HDV04_003521 [Boothiomyces sp. JEL0838]|nr:hypothetical protein HDV04_003521 [Boothiomyces sp. JEL0838]